MSAPPAARFGTAAWAALTAAAFAYVGVLGTNFPFMDEWATLDALANREPLWPWLWDWHNEHLLPVPRLIYWGLFQLTHDLRAGMLVTVAGWSLLARLLMRVAARCRGRAAVEDVFFPLAILHWGNHENLLMSYQLGFMCSTLLAGVGLVLTLTPAPSAGRAWGVAACAAVLPLCGAHGLLFAVPLAGWLVYVAVRGGWRVPCAVGVLAVVAMGWVYVTARPPTPDWVPPLTAGKFAVGLLGYGAMGYGAAGRWLWPASAALPAAAAVLMLTTSRAVRGGWRRPEWSGRSGSSAAG